MSTEQMVMDPCLCHRKKLVDNKNTIRGFFRIPYEASELSPSREIENIWEATLEGMVENIRNIFGC